MDFNHSFLNWLLEQSQIGLDGQLGESPKPQDEKLLDLSSNSNSNSNSSDMNLFSISVGVDGFTVNDSNGLDALLSQGSWSNNHVQRLNSPPLQFSGSSGSSTSVLSDNNDKETMGRHASQPQTTTSTSGRLKPFVPGNTEGACTGSHRTMPAVGVLDFRVNATEDYKVSNKELKKMTSKERRQYRNKISARSFRQRRKCYTTSLEELIEKLESEKAQLKLEVTKVYDIVGKLQKENDQLRVELIVAQQPVATAAVVPVKAPSTAPPPTTTNANANAIDETTITMWDDFMQNSNWLSHVAMPQWDFSQILSKDQERSPSSSSLIPIPAHNTFRRYPLLGPALMSIVIDHTMGLSTGELVKITTGVETDKTAKTYLPLTFETVGNRALIEEVKGEEDSNSEDEEDTDGPVVSPAIASVRVCIKEWLKKNIYCNPSQPKEQSQAVQQKAEESFIGAVCYFVSNQIIEISQQKLSGYPKPQAAVRVPHSRDVGREYRYA